MVMCPLSMSSPPRGKPRDFCVHPAVHRVNLAPAPFQDLHNPLERKSAWSSLSSFADRVMSEDIKPHIIIIIIITWVKLCVPRSTVLSLSLLP